MFLYLAWLEEYKNYMHAAVIVYIDCLQDIPSASIKH
jgi:hypothetical protein